MGRILETPSSCRWYRHNELRTSYLNDFISPNTFFGTFTLACSTLKTVLYHYCILLSMLPLSRSYLVVCCLLHSKTDGLQWFSRPATANKTTHSVSFLSTIQRSVYVTQHNMWPWNIQPHWNGASKAAVPPQSFSLFLCKVTYSFLDRVFTEKRIRRKKARCSIVVLYKKKTTRYRLSFSSLVEQPAAECASVA